MRILTAALISALALLFVYPQIAAAQRMSTGSQQYRSSELAPGKRMIAGTMRDGDLIATGARDAVTSPTRIYSQIRDDTKNFGPVGIVSGTVRGGVRAGGQALKGGARMAIGILDILTSPFGRID